jgi:hypothetical protein
MGITILAGVMDYQLVDLCTLFGECPGISAVINPNTNKSLVENQIIFFEDRM